jgi:TRAP-type C4-dicarboxylate transport system permease small subunit
MKEIIYRFAADLPKVNKVSPDNTQGDGNQLSTVVINIINAIIGVLGLVAVIVIILGGVQYMTSSGDAAKVKKAKDTILYGVIGLIVCVLAFAIVNFVIANIIQTA